MSLFHDDKHCSCCGRDDHRRDRDKDKDCRRKDKDRDRCKGAFCGRFWKKFTPGTEVTVTLKGGETIEGSFVAFDPKTCLLTLADRQGNNIELQYVDCECICHVEIES